MGVSIPIIGWYCHRPLFLHCIIVCLYLFPILILSHYWLCLQVSILAVICCLLGFDTYILLVFILLILCLCGLGVCFAPTPILCSKQLPNSVYGPIQAGSDA